MNRTTLENQANRIGYTLTEASRQTQMEAISAGEPAPKWEVYATNFPHRDTVRGFTTLAKAKLWLDCRSA